MESIFKFNAPLPNRIRSGSNKENQTPSGGNLRFKNQTAQGPLGIPFKVKNLNGLNNYQNGISSNLVRNPTNQYEKLNNNFIRRSNTSYSSDDLNSLTSSGNSLRTLSKCTNQSLILNSSNNSNSSLQNKINDLCYKSTLSGSTSSLFSFSSSNGHSIKEDKRHLPPPPKQNIMYHEQRYKTELCRAYEEQKNCVYGDRCMFAHGHWELKKPQNRHPKYKTQKCVAFEEQGLCMFGTRCSFLHDKLGSAEDIVNSMLKLNKKTFPMPENPSAKKESMQLNKISEQEFLTKSIDGMEQRAQFLSTLKSENLFNWNNNNFFSTKPSDNSSKNLARLDLLHEQIEKDKLLPDLTSLLVDEHANTNTLLFNDSTSNSSRLPVFKKIASNTSLEMSANGSTSSLIDIIDSTDNSETSSNNSSKCMDFEIEKIF